MLKIDTHAHWFPPEWVELIKTEGAKHGAKVMRNERGNEVVQAPGIALKGNFLPTYVELAERLKLMDAARVDMHALSLTSPMVYWAPPEFGLKLSQVYNDACAAAHLKYPQRFVGMMMVPMQAPELAVQEIERAAKLPGIRGVYMATHVNGKNLDEQEFWPVYAACEKHGMPIFLHPVSPVGTERMRKYHLGNFLGNPYETGIAAASLMFGGVMDKFPHLDVMLPHAGGTFPHLIGRMDHGTTVRAECKHMTKPPSSYLRRFHYDTITHSDSILLNLIRQVGADRVVMGSDCPADMSYTQPVQVIERMNDLKADERELIVSGNAARLLKVA
ncbi:MAG: amidohydrolase [Betaproteobacteria bacterium]|jgi:aminocarboxymuconate-semialdehyde decarboxylase|nr:amidohydrolase [Betaproteobacteria bacterium]